MEFYQTFADILGDAPTRAPPREVAAPRIEIVDDNPPSDAIQELDQAKAEAPTLKQLARAEFRKQALEEYGKTIAMIKTLAPALTNTIRKPQRLLYDDPDYYVAIDCVTNTYYICYRTLLMIDIDFYKDLSTVDLIVDKFERYTQTQQEKGRSLLFRLFKSRNGVHGFLISQESSYTDNSALQLELELESDFYYIIYSYIRGWSVRLNKKALDTSDVLYEFICDVGTAKPNDHLLKLVDLHLKLVDVFKDTGINTMFGN